MRHRLALARIAVAGAALLFSVLVLLVAIEQPPVGKATSATRVNVLNSSPVTCLTVVGTGFNTVSFSCISTAEARDDVVNDTDIWAMYQYVPGESDAWRTHNPNLPGWVVSDLQFLSRKTGYVMVMNASHAYNFSGASASSTSVPLVVGWNLVGYPSSIVRNASSAFAAVNLTTVRTYNNSAGAYIIYPGGGLNETRPGEGYWINATQATSWVVS